MVSCHIADSKPVKQEVSGTFPGHKYRKTRIDCLRFIMCPLLALVFQGRLLPFLDAANKAGGMRHSSVYIT
jgi:hypothetical protein